MSFEDPFAITPPRALCWRMFDLIPTRAQGPLGEVLRAAAEQTRPAHAAEIPVKQVDQGVEGCDVVVSGTRRRERTQDGFVHDVWVEQSGARVAQRTTGPLWPIRAEAQDFTAIFEEAWRIASPPPPAAPVAETESDSQRFVDDELLETRAEVDERAVVERSRTWVTVLATTGLSSRELSADFGRAINQGVLASLGARAALHLGSVLGPAHRLDLQAGYWRQFAGAELGGESIGAEADRFRLGAAYAHRVGAGGPHLGCGLGYEFRRFGFEEGAGVLSIEYSILRPGLSVTQQLIRTAGFDLEVFGRGHLRVPLDDQSVSNDLGVDFGGGVGFHHAVGFVAELGVDYTLQSGSSSQGDFDDGFLDLQIALGWTL